MAAPTAKGGVGWAILAVALAIPGFLFYNWWSHLKAERQKAISQKARGRVPEGGVFSTPAPGGEKLVNPIAASTSAPVAASSAPATAAASSLVPPASAAVTAPDAAPVVPDPAAVLAGATSAAPAASTAPVAVLALPRDPTLSPMDLVRMQQEEMEKRMAEERMRDELNRKRNPPKRVEPPIENYVDLQGIVANADGENKAIVNDVVVGVGESFDARGRSVRVLRITAAGVTFQYKTKRFVKNVSRDE